MSDMGFGGDFQPDPWLYVETRTADDARRFFGAPEGWPVEFVQFDPEARGGRIWRVKAEGLQIGRLLD